ncbi:MAG: cation transporter [Clostridiales bacterium]|nr:cation transporter [Clostridiales bacterium]
MKQESKKPETDQQVAMRVSGVSIFVNVVLSLFKLLAGIIAGSGAMISDAIHSASDVASTVVVIIGVNMAGKKSDKEHQYGHERLECVSSILLAGLLMVTGVGIGISGIQKIIDGTSGKDLMVPGMLALVAAVVSLVVKEWMFWYTRAAAKKINSGALMADAWHHRSDALSSIGAFIGILGARMGYPILDPIASVVICIFIAKAAIDIFRDAIDKMVDHSCDEKTVQEMRKVILETEGVQRIDVLRTRLFGSKIYVDIEIAADDDMTLKEAHTIAEEVHRSIEKKFAEVKHCMVHVNPVSEEWGKNRNRSI